MRNAKCGFHMQISLSGRISPGGRLDTIDTIDLPCLTSSYAAKLCQNYSLDNFSMKFLFAFDSP